MKIPNRHEAQQAFLLRGRTSLAKAKQTGEFHPLDEVLDGMRARLALRLDQARTGCRSAARKP